MIKLVIFDLDNTLYLERHYVLSGFRAVANFLEQKTKIKSKKLYSTLVKLFDQDGRGKNFDNLLDKFGVENINKEMLIKIYRKHVPSISLDVKTKNILNHLHKKFILVLLTNGWPIVQRKKVKALKLNRYFNSFFYAQKDGLKFRKPHNKFFLKILKRYRIKPNEALVVGDDLICDIQGANKLGFEVFHIKKISDLKQLVKFLK